MSPLCKVPADQEFERNARTYRKRGPSRLSPIAVDARCQNVLPQGSVCTPQPPALPPHKSPARLRLEKRAAATAAAANAVATFQPFRLKMSLSRASVLYAPQPFANRSCQDGTGRSSTLSGRKTPSGRVSSSLDNNHYRSNNASRSSEIHNHSLSQVGHTPRNTFVDSADANITDVRSRSRSPVAASLFHLFSDGRANGLDPEEVFIRDILNDIVLYTVEQNSDCGSDAVLFARSIAATPESGMIVEIPPFSQEDPADMVLNAAAMVATKVQPTLTNPKTSEKRGWPDHRGGVANKAMPTLDDLLLRHPRPSHSLGPLSARGSQRVRNAPYASVPISAR